MDMVAEAPQIDSPTRKKGGRVVRLVQLAFLIGIAAAVAFGLYSITREQTAGGAPEALGGMQLLQKETGAAAVAEMSALHQSDIRITGGWVGHYQHSAVIYVGEATSGSDAARLVDQMTSRIRQANGMFAHQGQEDVDGLIVHVVKSGDQMHFYYARGKKVIWIAGPIGMDPGGFVNEALTII